MSPLDICRRGLIKSMMMMMMIISASCISDNHICQPSHTGVVILRFCMIFVDKLYVEVIFVEISIYLSQSFSILLSFINREQFKPSQASTIFSSTVFLQFKNLNSKPGREPGREPGRSRRMPGRCPGAPCPGAATVHEILYYVCIAKTNIHQNYQICRSNLSLRF